MLTQVLTGYESLSLLREGSACSTYRAKRIRDGLPVVLKKLRAEHPAPEDIAGLRREYELLRKVDVPSVIKAHALENQGWQWALVLEDFGGQSLDVLQVERPWVLEERLEVAIEIVRGLGELHARNIIHKDLTPANIVWNPATGTVKLIDLGIATMLSRERPLAKSLGHIEGTLLYLAPEQTGRVNQALDHRADLYSLGATLCEFIAGSPPFPMTDLMELVHAHIARVPVDLHTRRTDVPQVVSDIVMRLLEKNPDARYQSTFGLQADLEDCLSTLRRLGTIESFEIGKHDITERFQVPEQMIGRERELAKLLGAFDSVSAPASDAKSSATICLVTGYSGIGKTTLVNELHKPILERRGYFLSGKFDQFQRQTPYSAFAAALGSLVQQILGERADAVEEWRCKILAALGANARLLVDIIPDLELVIGEQPPVADLEPEQARNRFHHAFASLIRVFAAPEHPLTILLDDMQWADEASLGLLERLFVDEQSLCLFFIAAYRDGEVDALHPLAITIAALDAAQVPIERIPLQPLELPDVAQIVAHAVGRPISEVQDLARIVRQKTEGNPLFVGELLRSLYEEGLLYFDRTAGRWAFSVEQIAARGIADNVVDLVVKKLRRMPEETQRAIELSACIGNQFDLETLRIVLGVSPAEAFQRILPAVQEGFVAATSGLVLAGTSDDPALVVREFRFVHDRVQQASYNLIDETERAKLHLRMGELLLADESVNRSDSLFRIVDHLNQGRARIEDQDKRLELARLNVEAARRARSSLAMSAARGYLEAGITCLGESAWNDHYELAFELHRSLVEALYLNGDYEACEAHGNATLKRAQSSFDKADVYLTIVAERTIRARYADALPAAKEALSLFGVDVPLGLSDSELQATMMTELQKAEAALGGRTIGSLADAPEMADPVARMSTSLLLKMLPAAFFTNPLLYIVVVFKAIGMSLQYGPSPVSADLFSNYGHLLSGMFGRHVDGYQLGELAIKLTQRFGRPDGTCRSAFHLANFISPWTKPLYESGPLNEMAYRAGLEGGDLIYSGYSLIYQPINKFYEGRPLSEVMTSLEGALQFARKTRNQIAIDILVGTQIVMENLRARTDATGHFSAGTIDEAAFLGEVETNKSTMALCFYLILKAEALFLHDDHEGALDTCAKVEPLLIVVMGNIATAHHALYQALALAARYDAADVAAKVQIRDKLGSLLERWESWAKTSPENFAHLAALVKGEVARIDGKHLEAAEHYEEAMAGARRGGFVQHVALAAELAGKLWLARGRVYVAAAYLREARHAHRIRGTVQKARLIDRNHESLIQETDPLEASGKAITTHTSITTTERGARGQLLDLASVLKASQAIGGELLLDRLLTKLMQILLQNAGAQKGAVIFDKAGELEVAVDASLDEARIDGTFIATVRSIALSAYQDASEEIIRYVARTRETIILSNAARESVFSASPYVVRTKAKSILCAPISSQGRLLGIIYLENDLTAGAFTRERLELLQLLSSQIAVSIENALLYREIEQRVSERTAELRERNAELQAALEEIRRTQAQLVQSEKMASLGRLTMGVAHEIKNPLNFVNNFAKIDIDLANEIIQVADENPSTPIEEVRDILGDLKVSAEKVVQYSKRADEIVQTMMRHAGGAAGQRSLVDINSLVDDVVKLAMHGARGSRARVDVRVSGTYDESIEQIMVVVPEIRRVVVNLIDNAIDAVVTRQKEEKEKATDYVPTVRVATRLVDTGVQIAVEDNGTGIPESIVHKVFEPFFTTKPTGQGTGLGLSLSYDIVVQGHKGKLDCRSKPGEGTAFIVTLPVNLPAA